MRQAIEAKMREEYQDLYDNRYEYLGEDQTSEEWETDLADTAQTEIRDHFDAYIDVSVRYGMISEKEAAELKELNLKLWNLLEDTILEEIDFEEVVLEEIA